MSRPLRTALLLFLGSLLIQAAWIVALPPFRGIDEFDHAYRAAAVAEGQWRPDYVPAPHGRGDLLVVPRSLVEAAKPVCESYDYTGHDNCNPVADAGDGNVTVASAAARYNPVFYWLIGTPAKYFNGAASLYVMRIVGSILCSLFIGFTGWIVASWSKTSWPIVGLVVALTPMVMYSSALGAPNGVEMLGGLSLWAALLGLLRVSRPATRRRLLLLAVPGSIAVVGVRALGPVWLVMIVLSAACMLGRRDIIRIVRRQQRRLLGVSVLVATATAAGAWWTIANATNSPLTESNANLSNPIIKSLSFTPLWIFQSIAAFPTRNETAPTLVYTTSLITLTAMFFLAMRNGTRRSRLTIVGCALASLAVSFVASASTYSQQGQVWQGRYALPYMIGIPLLLGLCLDQSAVRYRLMDAGLRAGFSLIAIAQAVSIADVLMTERRSSPLAGTPEWHAPSPWLTLLLAGAGVALWLIALGVGRGSGDDEMGAANINTRETPTMVIDSD